MASAVGVLSRLCVVGMGDANRRNCLQVVSFASEPEGVCRSVQMRAVVCLDMGRGWCVPWVRCVPLMWL